MNKLISKPNFYKITSIALLFLFLLIPGRSGWFDGIPLSQLHEITAIFLIIILLICIPHPKFNVLFGKRLTIIIGFLIFAKVLIGWISLENGLVGYYYYPAIGAGNLQPSTEFQNLKEGTRIDKKISFLPIAYPAKKASPFPIYFLNKGGELAKANPTEKSQLPFYVQWEGYIFIPENINTISLKSDGRSELFISNKKIFDTETSSNEVNIETLKKKTLLPVKINYQSSAGSDKYLKLSWKSWASESGLASNQLYIRQYPNSQLKADFMVNIADYMLKIIFILTVLSTLVLFSYKADWRKWYRTYKPLLFTAILGVIILTAYPLLNSQKTNVDILLLRGGDDPLTYERFARHIQLTGDWLMKDAKLEQIPYYYSLYYYFLALMHFIAGESLFGVFIFNIFLLFLIGLISFFIGKSSVKNYYWIFLPIIPFLAIHPTFINIVILPYPDLIAIFLVMAALLLLVKSSNKSRILLLTAGIAIGLSSLSRFNFIGWLPFVFIWLIFKFKRKFIMPSLMVAIGLFLILAPPIARNYHYGGKMLLFSRSISTNNFMQSFGVPEDYQPKINFDSTAAKITDKFFEATTAFRHVLWIKDNPIAYAKIIINKITNAFVYGHTGSIDWRWFAPFILFLAASAVFLIKPSFIFEKLQRKDYLLAGGFILSQIFIVSIISSPELRYYLPAIPIMAIYSMALIRLLFKPILQIPGKFLQIFR